MRRSGLILILVAVGFSARVAEGEVVEKIVAVVGESPILLSEVDEAVAFARAAGDTSSEEDLRRRTLQQLVEDRVVVETARREGVEAPPREVEEEAARREKELRDQFADPTEFAEQLRREGLTEAQFTRLQEEMARDQILARRFLETVRSSWTITVTDAEIDSFYEENRAQLPVEPERVKLCHVLIRFGEDPSEVDSVIARARDLRRRAEAGEDFIALAREYSDGPAASRGGDLGFLERGQVLPEFEEVAFALAPGEVGGPVRTSLGYHVVKVDEVRDDRVRARHILLTLKAGDAQREAARARADSLWDSLIRGRPFDELVKAASDDSATRDDGGCLGIFNIPSLPPLVQEALDTLDVNEISTPIELEDGYHVYRIAERTPAGPASREDIGPRIRLVLQQQKLEQKYREWVTQLKEDIYIKVFDQSSSAVPGTDGS